MKQLEIKHLAPYLPYGLKIANRSLKGEILNVYELDVENNNDHGILNVLYGVNQIPILRKLSDITKEITHNGETFVPIVKIQYPLKNIDLESLKENILGYPFDRVQQLIEWHFDVFNIINDGLAIPVIEDFTPLQIEKL